MSDPSSMFSGTKEVDERFRFDEGALAAYLKENIDGFSGDLQVRQFKGGQSDPTYALRGWARIRAAPQAAGKAAALRTRGGS